MFIRFTHTPFGRVLRVVIGFLLVVEAVYEPLAIAASMVVVGTVIAVTGIADVCVLEQVITAMRRDAAAREPRERHA